MAVGNLGAAGLRLLKCSCCRSSGASEREGDRLGANYRTENVSVQGHSCNSTRTCRDSHFHSLCLLCRSTAPLLIEAFKAAAAAAPDHHPNPTSPQKHSNVCHKYPGSLSRATETSHLVFLFLFFFHVNKQCRLHVCRFLTGEGYNLRNRRCRFVFKRTTVSASNPPVSDLLI